MKKQITTLGITFAAIALVGCKGGSNNPVENIDTLGFEAATAISLMTAPSGAFGPQGAMRRVPLFLNGGSEDSSDTTEVSDPSSQPNDVTDPFLDQLIVQLDFLYSNGSGFKSETSESDREDYARMQTISLTDATGKEEIYKLYYNDEKVEIENDDDDDDSGLDYEIKTKIRGIAIVNDVEYQFKSKVEVEVEAEDDEYEEEMTFHLFLDDDNYVLVQQEIEIEAGEREEEFFYQVVVDGETVYEYNLEIEFEDNDEEMELEITVNGDTYKLEYEVDTGDSDILAHIQVKVNGELIATYAKVLVTDAETGETSIEYLLMVEE
ncbi:MAG: hypothetical protein ACOX3K_01990 [Bacilli bacterium]|jgi:hypothetical protein